MDLLRFVRWRKIPFDPKKTWDMGSKFKPFLLFFFGKGGHVTSCVPFGLKMYDRC